MKFFTIRYFFLVILCITGCENKKSHVPELVSIDLLRGDITLCGTNQLGEVSFSLSCNDSTQETFNLALALLHSFEYDEAEKAFVKIIDSDPNCVMAYWGVAMSIYHALWAAPNDENLEKGSMILKIAESLPKTTREQEYLNAIGAYFKDWKTTDSSIRAKKYEEEMEKIYEKYEDDSEAAILYALALNSTADPTDQNYTNQRKAGNILESLFPDQPNHPGIAHYIIHNYDNPMLAELALPTARKYAKIAPASAHAQHMPSHIFTRLGLWDESIQSNLISASSAICYAEQSMYEGQWSKEIHAIGYLVYAYLQKGDNEKASEQSRYMRTMNIVSPKWDHRTAAYQFAAVPARVALENKQWSLAAKLKPHISDINWEQFPWEKAIIHFTRVLGSSRTGDTKSAEKELNKLDSLQQVLQNQNEIYKANQVMIQVVAGQAWLNFARGNHQEALLLMNKAAIMEDNTEKHPTTPCEVLPAKELLADLLFALNQPQLALQAYEANLMRNPNRFNSIYGAAIASKNLGDKKRASVYFEDLLKLAEGVASDRAELVEAREYLR